MKEIDYIEKLANEQGYYPPENIVAKLNEVIEGFNKLQDHFHQIDDPFHTDGITLYADAGDPPKPSPKDVV